MLQSRILVLTLAVVVMIAGSIQARAETPAEAQRRRDAVREKRAKVASQLNALKASDLELETAVRTLDGEVGRAQSKVSAAESATRAAEVNADQARATLAGTNEKLVNLRRLVTDQAVLAYVSPRSTSGMPAMLSAKDLNEASRRQTLMQAVVGNDRDVLERLRGAQDDQEQAQAEAAEATGQAAMRRDKVRTERDRVAKARGDQGRLSAALDRRIASFQAEADALSREEATLAALIRTRQATSTVSAKVSGSGLAWPLKGTITSEYGPRWGRIHEGMDISAPNGTPIRAAKGGQVIFVGSQGGYGNMTLINHGGGLVTAYPHQSRFGTREGANVEQGDVIGYVGCSGSCTGPHLHFETRINGAAQNPRRYLP